MPQRTPRPAVLASVTTHDVRFPTSRLLDGSDAMNPEPDYSAAYVVLGTDAGDGLEGHGFAFTIGRGNDVQVAAVELVAAQLVGRPVDELLGDLGATARALVADGQLRWLGPEKGVLQMATGAVLNALWDLRAKREGKPLWQVLADMSPDEVADLVDYRYLGDALTREEAVAILRAARPGREERLERLRSGGYPAYTTTPGWLGYSDEKLVRLCREAVADGFSQVKLKVGADAADDVRRCALAREAIGPDVALAVDANQRWEVPEAIERVRELAPFGIRWIEEPTSPDDVLGHRAIAEAVAPVAVATGEHVQNRVVFKQLMAAGAVGIVQIDCCRVAGVNENVAILLMAAKHGLPVCPHAGGVGLCEVVRHLSFFDYLSVSATLEGRVVEWVDHLHEHFTDPAVVRGGAYVLPSAPGASTEMLPGSLAEHAYPHGPVWAAAPATAPDASPATAPAGAPREQVPAALP